MDKEIYKSIKGHNDYKVSNLGNVISCKSHKNKSVWKQMKKSKHNGYVGCMIDKHLIDIHRLVAEAFIPNPNHYNCVNHKDENKLNNNADNLEWCSTSYNNTYNDKHLKIAKKNEKKVFQYDLDGNLVNVFNSRKEAAETVNGFGTLITRCCLGKSITYKNYVWKNG